MIHFLLRESLTVPLLSFQTAQAKLDAETEKKHTLLPSSFVVFRSLRSSTLANQADWDNSPLAVDVMPAPELTSVLWTNLSIGLWERYRASTVLVQENTAASVPI